MTVKSKKRRNDSVADFTVITTWAHFPYGLGNLRLVLQLVVIVFLSISFASVPATANLTEYGEQRSRPRIQFD